MSPRKSRLFHREKMQPIHGKDYLKVAAIIGVISIPLIVGLAI
ncbi:MAG: hypothetical protein OES15_04890 [Nitrosopumilus sp.]|nr:hypothetical protein [Nitrosopumilus sp.]